MWGEVDNEVQASETLNWSRALYFPRADAKNSQYFRFLTPNWSEHVIRCGYSQICSGKNNTSLLLYVCEVIHLINKGCDFTVCSEVGWNNVKV